MTLVAYLSFVGPTNCISSMLTRHNIKTVGLLPKKAASFLWPIKDGLGLKTPCIYSIPCKCGKVYIGQTEWSGSRITTSTSGCIISCDWALHKLGSLHPVSRHEYPGHEIWMPGWNTSSGKWKKLNVISVTWTGKVFPKSWKSLLQTAKKWKKPPCPLLRGTVTYCLFDHPRMSTFKDRTPQYSCETISEPVLFRATPFHTAPYESDCHNFSRQFPTAFIHLM
jgi:hypothetical protein